jgi:hypothetical protein
MFAFAVVPWFVKKTFVSLSAMAGGEDLAFEKSVVDVPPTIGTLMTVPSPFDQ